MAPANHLQYSWRPAQLCRQAQLTTARRRQEGELSATEIFSFFDKSVQLHWSQYTIWQQLALTLPYSSIADSLAALIPTIIEELIHFNYAVPV